MKKGINVNREINVILKENDINHLIKFFNNENYTVKTFNWKIINWFNDKGNVKYKPNLTFG